MKKCFEPDGGFTLFFRHLPQLLLINLLMLVCSIPVITIGASCGAAYKCMQNLSFGTEFQIAPAFFKSFRENFKTLTPVWLVTFVLTAVFMDLYKLIHGHVTGFFVKPLYFILGVLIFILVSYTSFLYPLIVRYQNTLREHMGNAFLLEMYNFIRAMGLAAVTVSPVAVQLVLGGYIPFLAVFVILVGFPAVMWTKTRIMKPVLEDVERNNDKRKAEQARREALEKGELLPEEAEDGEEL